MLAGKGSIHCLETNKDGSPKHPLYIKKDTKPKIYLPKSLFRKKS